MMKKVIPAIALTSLLFLAGCEVGPNYSRPPVPTAPSYRGPDGVATSSDRSFADDKWSTVFQDPALQELVNTAIKQNYDLRVAATRVLQAQEQITITRSNQFPNVGVGPGVTGVRQPGIPNVFPAYSYLADALNVSVSWNADFWGRYRRATEASRASYLATEWGRRAVLSTVVENVITSYFQLREYDLELDIARRTLASRQQSLRLTQTLEEGGATSLVDVRQAQQLVEEAAASIPQSEQAIQQTEDQISLLLGETPQAIKRGAPITNQPLPETVPAGLPSQLLERRPDIQQAEQNLVTANAEIGVARAQLFPQVPLTATAGVESIGLGNIFAWGARSWNWSAQLSQPIFNAGALRANVRYSQAQQQQYLVTYQQTIQTAFREVADSLIAYTKLRDYRQHEEKLTEYSKSASDLAHMRYQGGATSYLEVLTAETNYFSAELALARAQLSERLSLVQLYNALGGGWKQ